MPLLKKKNSLTAKLRLKSLFFHFSEILKKLPKPWISPKPEINSRSSVKRFLKLRINFRSLEKIPVAQNKLWKLRKTFHEFKNIFEALGKFYNLKKAQQAQLKTSEKFLKPRKNLIKEKFSARQVEQAQIFL